MPPKKRDKETEVTKYNIGGRDQLQADHELFLQAFEKPTQIYRFLRTRNMISPVFLHRNLTYMKHRMTRTNKKRSDFKIDSMLDDKINKVNMKKPMKLGDYMTLMFLGFFDKAAEELQCDVVRVETILLKISHKKRKDSSSPLMQITMGSSDVPVNPTETGLNEKIPAISIPAEAFKPFGAPLNRSYILLLRVETLPKIVTKDDGEEPSAKRPKSATKVYGSELVIFDKHSRCLLAEGEYELALQELLPSTKKCSPKKHSTWEVISDDTNLEIFQRPDNPFEIFNTCPALKFCLKWTSEICSGYIERPKFMRQESNESTQSCDKDKNNVNGVNHNNNTFVPSKNAGKDALVKIEEPIQIVYQFIYNNNSRQQTDACADMHCPWCSLNCVTLYSLLKHLKLCHARFTFTYVPMPTGARIDVAINDMYDGSYTGSPHDLLGPSGCAFTRTGPVRRTTVTHVLVCRPRRAKPSLTEFLELDENEVNNQRPYVTGHNRLYHHTETCLPVHPKELDIDSEGESDPLWLQHKTMQMIDEFTDVNEGEKEIMKMWNLHVMKHGFVGDCQLPLACDMFLDSRGRDLLEKNLYRNFVLHMCSLFDYGLVSPEVVYKTVQKLQSILSTFPEGRKVITESRETQLDHWLKVGKQKQEQMEEQKQKQQQQQQSQKQLTDTKNIQNSITKIHHRPPKLSTDLRKMNTLEKEKNDKAKEKDSKSSQMIQITESNKRRISQLRESPPRRKSAPSAEPPKNLPTRRKSIAVTSTGTSASTSAQSSSVTMRKRVCVTLTKVDKH